ncbi:immunoglobulin-like domain-containing protein [uncultured Oscillibacter sp.]|uniref:immunoglobulin-like domain-containing protein n=1 Tax=uncultured Oscillibacter sp. TaxID=876091 RepID=UPI001F983958|nr:immunoglobulin-like domain-containing protein [uncultured Oscillibacter sp.]HJB32660.1 hypothetical protein [Candidatus Oscillibacter excrementavium]
MEMKRLWICLLALLVLAGCGGNPTDVGVTLVVPQSAGSYSLNMETEWMEYDPSVDSIWCILSYEGEGEPLEFGAEYRLEVQTDSGWEKVPWKNEAWEDILYTLPAGESWAFPCVLSLFDYDFTEGTYRVVKDLEVLPGEAEPLPCWAEFTLRKGAAVSAEAPYGFGPMEEVPEYGDPAELAASGAVVFTEAGTENADAAETFLDKVSLGIPCQLRTLQSYYESWPMLIDVIYENGSFLWRMRTGGEITEKRFSYIVTDGADVYLSNGADWTATEAYDSDRAFLVPSGSGSGLLSVAQELMGGQTTGNTAWYRVWTQDGGKSAFLTRTPTEFGVEGSDSGSLYDLGDWYDSAPSITGLAWQADGTLRLTCETAEGGTVCYDFDPESGYLTEALCGLPTAN